MIGIKEIAYVTAASVALSIVIFAWYAFGAPLTQLDLTSDVNQMILVGIGVVICFVAYAFSKPEF
ncbi:hypothetical protein MmiHf6_01150 [Methanimicrococcus hongohii]|uniref:Uncharacterized protein n=1 Tax=Methanimicrococcus hongohii TaxID=3028295 RepID=A0AA96V024_9EURY|nr:hypothetical protein [Methanimicrococcus sp. Hf6]WNY22830.1 hypothetical protein MmiHf6_01150 [Methanimicrococcus sp. Hf6]